MPKPLTVFSLFQSLSCVPLFVTPWTTVSQASLSITNPRSLPKLMSIELVMPSNHLILCHSLLLLPLIFLNIRVFSNELALCIRNTQDWSPLGWAGWISLQSKGLSRVFSNITVLYTVSYILLSLLKPWSPRLLSDLSKISKWMSKSLRFNPNSICLYNFLQVHGTRASTNCGP